MDARDQTRRHTLIAAAFALVLSVATAACTDDSQWVAPLGEPTAADSAPPSTSTTKATPESWLFAMNSASARSVDTAAGFTVTIAAPGDVLAFTDRPARDAHRLRTEWLVQNWDLLFSDDPPNGVLSGLDQGGRAVEIAVEITGVTGDGDELVVAVRSIGGDVDATAPDPLADVALFIDDVVAPTMSSDWTFHSVIPDEASTGRYIARTRMSSGGSSSSSNYVYSFPAAALVEGYSTHPLDAPSAGVELHG
jgi:hypothetical protein